MISDLETAELRAKALLPALRKKLGVTSYRIVEDLTGRTVAMGPDVATMPKGPKVEVVEQHAPTGSVRWCYGKTPMQTFIGTLPTAKEKLMQAA